MNTNEINFGNSKEANLIKIEKYFNGVSVRLVDALKKFNSSEGFGLGEDVCSFTVSYDPSDKKGIDEDGVICCLENDICYWIDYETFYEGMRSFIDEYEKSFPMSRFELEPLMKEFREKYNVTANR